jgi:predicted DNA-binding protein YlxM (UPF0122 family)
MKYREKLGLYYKYSSRQDIADSTDISSMFLFLFVL